MLEDLYSFLLLFCPRFQPLRLNSPKCKELIKYGDYIIANKHLDQLLLAYPSFELYETRITGGCIETTYSIDL